MKKPTLLTVLTAISCLTLICTPCRALTVPATEDTSSLAGRLTQATGKANALAVSATKRAYVKFDFTQLPGGLAPSQISSARLRLYVPTLKVAGLLEVRKVTSAWQEDPTPAAAEPTRSAGVSDSIQVSKAKRFVYLDVTPEVVEWLTSPGVNNGLSLESAGNFTIGSKEGSGTGYPAELEIQLDAALPLLNESGALAAGTVGTTQIVTGSVTNSSLAANSVTNTNLADGSVTIEKLAPRSFTENATAGNVALSNNVTFSTTSTTLVDTGIEATLVTTGRPVCLQFTNKWVSSSTASGSTASAFLAIQCNGEEIYNVQFRVDGGRIVLPASIFNHIHVPAAGTQVYKVFLKHDGGTAALTNVRLVAYEL